jgi:hypothetical protein
MFQLLKTLLGKDPATVRAEAYRQAIHEEAKVGGRLFGEVPKGNRREFFCLDEHTWIWHEEWNDANGEHHVLTTRYDVRPHGIFKAQDGQPYQPLTMEETLRLVQAIHRYNKTIDDELAPLMEAWA